MFFDVCKSCLNYTNRPPPPDLELLPYFKTTYENGIDKKELNDEVCTLSDPQDINRSAPPMPSPSPSHHLWEFSSTVT